MKINKLTIIVFFVMLFIILGLLSFLFVIQNNKSNKEVEKSDEKTSITPEPWYETLETPKSWDETLITVP